MDSDLDTFSTIRSELWSAVPKAFLGRIVLLEEDAMDDENTGKIINAANTIRATKAAIRVNEGRKLLRAEAVWLFIEKFSSRLGSLAGGWIGEIDRNL
jgi:hypothetical protein